MPTILAYYKIRGIAQAPRLLLHYCGEEFEDKYYDIGPAPEYARDEWLKKDKFNMGFAFPNLPYLIDGDIKITQSNAVLRYIGRKHNLCGDTVQEKAAVDVALDQIMDIRNLLVKLCYNPNPDKDEYIKGLPPKLEAFSNCLGANSWLTGDKITFPDFHLYEQLDEHRILFPGCLDAFKNLQEYCDRFEALPAIKAYMDSDAFIKSPINGPMAPINN